MRNVFTSILLLISVQCVVLAEPVVRVEVFCDSSDKSCTFVRDEVIAPLAEEYPAGFAFRYYDTERPGNRAYFNRVESAYDDSLNSLPAVFIGNRFIGGRLNIKNKLPRRVKTSLTAGTGWADTSRARPSGAVTPGTVHALVFYSPDCGYCKEVKAELLPVMKKKYGNRVFFHLVDIETSKGNGILRVMEKKHGEPGNYIPIVYVDGTFLSGKNEVDQRLEWLLGRVIKRGGCDVPAEAR